VNHWWILWLGIPAAGFSVACLAARILIFVAPRIGYHDHPAERKLHIEPMPLLGGLAVGIAVLVCGICYLALGTISPNRFILSACAALPAFLLGLADDRFVMTPIPKLTGFFLVSVLPGIIIPAFLGGTVIEGMLFSILIFFFTNSLNLLDNSDGLCATVGFCILLSTVFFHADPSLLAAALCIAGFLVFNWPPARIFLGDTGSLLIGVVCVIAVFCPAGSTPLISWNLLPLMCVPLYDTFSVIIIRLIEHRPIMQGGLDHMSHRLMRRGIRCAGLNIFLGGYTLLVGFIVMACSRNFMPGIIIAALAGLFAVEWLLHSRKQP
jgi:UDP-GlcNAc:undecaprenyl-phosphate GlcNAc-1-phosphate transferase